MKKNKKIKKSIKKTRFSFVKVRYIAIAVVALVAIASYFVFNNRDNDSRVLALHDAGLPCTDTSQCKGVCTGNVCVGNCKNDYDCSGQKCSANVCSGICDTNACCTKRGCGYIQLGSPDGCDASTCYELDGFSRCGGQVAANGTCTYYGKQCVGR